MWDLDLITHVSYHNTQHIFRSLGLSISLFNASITMMKRRGERGSPCLKPLVAVKKEDGPPLTMRAKLVEVIIQHLIQSLHLEPKPNLWAYNQWIPIDMVESFLQSSLHKNVILVLSDNFIYGFINYQDGIGDMSTGNKGMLAFTYKWCSTLDNLLAKTFDSSL